jgi:hypothetical protein
MPIKDGKIAREMDVWNALVKNKSLPSGVKVKIVLPLAYNEGNLYERMRIISIVQYQNLTENVSLK